MSALPCGRRNDGRRNDDPACGRCGFSLLELLAVTTIIGIVASVVLPRIGESASNAKGKVCLEYKAQLNVAAEKFFIANGKTPRVVTQLQEKNYYGSPVPVCPVDGNTYRLEPNSGRVIGHNH